MSLSELKAQAEAEEVKAPEVEDVNEVDEPDTKADDEQDEPEVTEPSDDFELELEGESDPDQQKYSPKDAIYHKMRKEKAKRQEAQSELQKVQDELEKMKAQIAGAQPKQAPSHSQPAHANYPPVPVLYENGINTPEQYNQAYQQWMGEIRRIDSEVEQRRRQQSDFERQLDERKEQFAGRAAKFMQENNISESRVISAIERATDEIDGATKIEGALIHLLDSVGDGGERVAFHIGTNTTAMGKIKALLAEDPNGFKAIAEMTRMATRLKPKNGKSISKAPPPDESLKGDGATVSGKRLQDQYDKETDPTKLVALRKKARELGVKLT